MSKARKIQLRGMPPFDRKASLLFAIDNGLLSFFKY